MLIFINFLLIFVANQKSCCGLSKNGSCGYVKKNNANKSILGIIKKWLIGTRKYFKKRDSNIEKNSFLIISFQHDGIYTKNSKIIDKKSRIQYSIFKTFAEHYMKEILNGSSYITTKYISGQLKRYQIDIETQELRIFIHKINLNFKKALKNEQPIIVSKNGWDTE